MIGQKGIPATIGGIERHVEELSACLVRRGIEVTVYTRAWYCRPSRRNWRGVKLIVLSSIRTKHLDAITHTFRATLHAMRSGADVLHYHGVGPALLSWLPRLFAPSKRVVVTFHCIDRRHEKWGIVARFFLTLGEFIACRAAHETIAVSRTLEHYAENLYRSRVRYIPNGVSAIGKPSRRLIAQMGLRPGGFILVVTRFVRHKGVHTVLRAWEKLSQLPSMSGYELVLVGGSAPGDSYIDEIRNFAGRLSRARLLGVKDGDQLASLYRYARVFVHASVSEGLPLVVLEAMSFGAPVLASDIPEHMELVGEHGWNFSADVPDGLARELRKLCVRGRRVKKMVRQTRSWAVKNFCWSKIAEETEDLYREILPSKGSPSTSVIRRYIGGPSLGK